MPPKLRFVASTDNASVDYYDAAALRWPDHRLAQQPASSSTAIAPGRHECGATGKGSRATWKSNCRPSKEMYLKVNTQTGYAVCGARVSASNLSAIHEYEADLRPHQGRQCITSLLQRVQRIDGKDLRTPIPIESRIRWRPVPGA
jgi:hypothetical protein